MPKRAPFVTIIVVNYKRKDLTCSCLDSLLKLDYPARAYEIVVVDNCSQDGSVEYLSDKYKGKKVTLLENKFNNYCQACNIGISNSKAEFVLLLNNDVVVTKGWLTELVKTLESETLAAAATSKLLNEDSTIQNVGLIEMPNFYWDERGAGKEASGYNKIAELEAVCAACVLFRRSALEQAGFLDEDFVMYGEDVDISLRLKRKGWKLLYAPASVAYHKKHGSSDEQFSRLAIEKNRLLLVAKHYPYKLACALQGSGYFTPEGVNSNSGQLFDLAPQVVAKLFKEHDPETSKEVAREFFAELKRIANYENKKLEEDIREYAQVLQKVRDNSVFLQQESLKNSQEQDARFKDLEARYKELEKRTKDYDREINTLCNKLRNSLDSGLFKDSEIIELQRDLSDYREEVDNLSWKLKDSLDSGLFKDSEVIELQRDLSDYREEVDNLSWKLKDSLDSGLLKEGVIDDLQRKLEDETGSRVRLQNELAGIYDSEGFRYLLNPLWKIAWYSRIIAKASLRKISHFVWGILAAAFSALIFIQAVFFIIERLAEILFGRFSGLFRSKRTVIPAEKLDVSFVIPDWNGLDLLKKCLASICAIDGFLEQGIEVLVVDDASDYDIAERIKDDFPQVRVIRNKRNLGFGRTCNRGIREARGELIVLLNNDIMVSKDFLAPLKEHFKDPDVFAVSPKMYYWDMRSFNYGLHMGKFRDGYINLWNEAETGNGDKVSRTSPTVFAVGGAICMRKRDFLWLGGFDDIYRPNCWEDIDISYRAQKRGLKVLYEPASLVYHKGAATLNYVRQKEIKNELLFMWKNITDRKMLFDHLNQLPRYLQHGKHSRRIHSLTGYLWALRYFIPALAGRFKESKYRAASDKKVLNRPMLYYRNFMRKGFKHEARKTILLITPFFLYPLTSGGKLRIYNLYKRLSDDYDLVLLSLIHDEKERAHIHALSDVFKEIHLIHPKTPNKDWFFPKRYKFSYSSLFIEEFLRLQDRLPMDAVHIESNELLYLTKYIKYAPMVYTEHDISLLSFFKSYYQRKTMGVAEDFVDYLKVVRSHHSDYGRIDKVIALSKEDVKEIKAFYPGCDLSLIRTGVDLRHFHFKEKTGFSKSLVFVGHFPHFPNEEAAAYFCEKIFPIIRRSVPDARITLVGSSPTEKVLGLSRIEGVSIAADVPDVNPYLQEAAVFVCPFIRSAGIKGKVLEAMASGTPVVCTRRGAYGIEALDGREIMIADSPEAFAAAVVKLLVNGSLYQNLACNARRLVEEKYDWDKIAGKLDLIYQGLTSDGVITRQSEDNKPICAKDTDSSSVASEGSKDRDIRIENKESLIFQPEAFPQKDTALTLMTEPAVKKEMSIAGGNKIAGDIIGRIDRIIALSSEYDSKQKHEACSTLPQELHLELTHLCNSRCITCDIWDNHQRNNLGVTDELSLRQINDLLASATLREVRTVVLSGGEPFLRADIVDICMAITARFPRASLCILTNGLNTEEVLSKTKEILRMAKPHALSVGTSLDGLGEKYDEARGVKSGFDRFLTTIRRLREELPQIKVSATFVLTPFNIDELLPCWEFAQDHGLDFFAQFGVPKAARSTEVFTWKDEDLNRINSLTIEIIKRTVEQGSDLKRFRDSLSTVSDKINLITKIYYWSHLVDAHRKRVRFSHACSADFTFAMFDPYGKAFLCPLLKERTIGDIRESAFDQIWSSREADKVRDYIHSGECSCWLVCTVFPFVDKVLSMYGDRAAAEVAGSFCQPGGRPVFSKTNAELNDEEFSDQKIVLSSSPQGITIGANYHCNGNCVFCLEGSYKPFSLALYNEFFEPRLKEQLRNAEFVSFCGMGELLLTPDIDKFLEHINRGLQGQNKVLTTNGLALNEGIARRILQNRYSVQVSLHASDAMLHERLTGIRSGFETIMNNIEYLVKKRRDRSHPHISLFFLANTLNIEDLPAFVELASKLGVDSVRCGYLTVFKPAHLKLSCFFKQEITNEVFDAAVHKARELNISLSLPPGFSSKASCSIRKPCSDPWKNIYVDTEGAVLPCCYSGEHFGNLNDGSISVIWNNEKFQQLRTDLICGFSEGMCRYCINNDPRNVNALNAHVSFRPSVVKQVLGEALKVEG